MLNRLGMATEPSPTALGQYLAEAADYKTMWRPIERALTGTGRQREERRLELARNSFESEFSWARKHLKRNDAVTWWMRWVQVRIIRRHAPPEVVQREAERVSRLSGIPAADVFLMMPSLADQSVLEHLMSLPIADIQNFRFVNRGMSQNLWITPHAVVTKFRRAEDRWKETRKDLMPVNEHAQVILRFPDGYEWVDLQQPFCDAEAQAMGHCGNRPSHRASETVLSLRKRVKLEGGNVMWRPVCTFILDTLTGFLGEMKGRANEKPIADYHPYIVGLLRLPIIKGIAGGGYEAHKNFSLDDLDPETREQLAEEKPMLLGMKKFIQRHGLNKEVREWIENSLKGYLVHGHWSGDEFTMLYERWETLAQRVGDQDMVRWTSAMRYDQIGGSHQDSQSKFLNDMEGYLYKALVSHFRRRNPDAEIPDDKERFLEVMREVDEDMFSLVQVADGKGSDVGRERAILSGITGALDGFDDGVFIWRKIAADGFILWHTEFSGSIPAAMLAEIISQNRLHWLLREYPNEGPDHRLSMPKVDWADAYDLTTAENALQKQLSKL